MFENLGFDCQVCVPNTTIIFHVQTHIFLHRHLKKKVTHTILSYALPLSNILFGLSLLLFNC
jgi:hypothetical protein